MKWDEIALKYGADKASSHHSYMPIYQEYIGKREVKSLFEIGCAHGKSLMMWAELLPDALITSVDIDENCRLHQRKNIAVIIADATDPARMAAVSALNGPFQVIIDDGEHDHNQVRIAFEELWWRLEPGGVYFIEDLDGDSQFVQDFCKQWDAKFIECDDKTGYRTKPGLIVLEKL